MHERLTGKYYLQKRFLGGYRIMVQVIAQDVCSYSFDLSPEYTYYRKARPTDLTELELPVVE